MNSMVLKTIIVKSAYSSPSLFMLLFFLTLSGIVQLKGQETYGPVPGFDHLAWHELEYYAFVHFGPNSFTDKEWGDGREKAEIFKPAKLDCRQWARTFKKAGMKGIIITAKHHDGFCLYPSKYSRHTVREAGWKNGRGDVLRELSDACREYGLKMGVYMSPWDRNHPTYGTPEYNDVFADMLTEVLTGYGPLFEVWFDGANGEGPNGKKQEYDFPRFNALVKKYQPQALIFSDAGPDIRWVGNENGIAGDTCWYTMHRDELFPAYDNPSRLNKGDEKGKNWLPAECDVSIRPGWFYHASQDDAVKTPHQLLIIWQKSVGRGANLLLNIPVTPEGLVHKNDIRALMDFKKLRDQYYRRPLFATSNLSRVNETTYEADLGKKTNFNCISVSENIALGQKVKHFRVLAFAKGAWKQVANSATMGRKRILHFPEVTADKIRIEITGSLASPVLKDIKVYKTP